MINVNNLAPGVVFKYQNNIYIVISNHHSKSARRQAIVKTKVKNLITKTNTILTFTGGNKIETLKIEKIELQFLYSNNIQLFFMNTQNYEQYAINQNKYLNEMNFINEGSIVKGYIYNNEIIELILPDNVELVVKNTTDAVKGNIISSATKNAVLITNYKIQVPLFIKNNDVIIVSTKNGKYISRK